MTRTHVAHDDSAHGSSGTAELGGRVAEYAKWCDVLVAGHVELFADRLGVVLVVNAAVLGQRHVEYAARVEAEYEAFFANDKR